MHVACRTLEVSNPTNGLTLGQQRGFAKLQKEHGRVTGKQLLALRLFVEPGDDPDEQTQKGTPSLAFFARSGAFCLWRKKSTLAWRRPLIEPHS
jgi:hypothetical protein